MLNGFFPFNNFHFRDKSQQLEKLHYKQEDNKSIQQKAIQLKSQY